MIFILDTFGNDYLDVYATKLEECSVNEIMQKNFLVVCLIAVMTTFTLTFAFMSVKATLNVAMGRIGLENTL